MTVVLCVDDNETNLYYIGTVLRRAGYEVVTATTGQEGIEAARRARPDLVLMDVNLPDIDGLEATRRIKAMPELAALPVIAISAHEESEVGAAAAAAGCDGYATKPLDWRALLSRMQALVAGTETQPSADTG